MNGSNVNSIFSDLYHAYLDNTTIITPGKTTLGGSPLRKLGIVSVFGRVNYNYKETYLATIVMRADASSNFAKGNRWGYFPSVSAGWVLSNEAFMESTKNWLDFLKVRASWGQNGNADIDPFQYLATISFSNSQYFFGSNKDIPVSGAYPDILPNKDVTWETIGDVEVVGTGNNVKVKLKNGAAASNATVIATSKADTEKKASCNVTIGAAAATISVSLADNTLRPGNSTTATVTPSAGATIRSVVWTATPSGKVSFANATTTAGTNTITVSNGAATGDVTIKAVATFTDGTTAENTCTLKVQNAVTISAANDKTTLTSWNDSVKLTAKVDGESAGNYTYTWTSNSPTVVSVSDNSANTVYATAGNTGTAAITVSVKGGSTEIGRATISIRVSYTTKFNPSATVYLDTTEYCLDDDDDEGKKSVIEQIEDSVPTAYWLKYVVFHGTDQAAGSLSADERYTYWTPDEYESGSRTGLFDRCGIYSGEKGNSNFSPLPHAMEKTAAVMMLKLRVPLPLLSKRGLRAAMWSITATSARMYLSTLLL